LDTATWIALFLLFFIIWLTMKSTKKKRQRNILKIRRLHKKKGGVTMSEVIKRFVDKECIITTMNETVTGIITAVEENWIVVSPAGNPEAGADIISLDYISRIREYPRKKNGKRRTVIT